jgi:hypothetical protein
MTSDQVRQIVEAEIGADWDRTNLHGCDLRRCLVEPRLVTFADSANQDLVELWLVLEEDPDACDGYKIIYDPEENAFGLAYGSYETGPDFIALYGDFLTTYYGMWAPGAAEPAAVIRWKSRGRRRFQAVFEGGCFRYREGGFRTQGWPSERPARIQPSPGEASRASSTSWLRARCCRGSVVSAPASGGGPSDWATYLRQKRRSMGSARQGPPPRDGMDRLPGAPMVQMRGSGRRGVRRPERQVSVLSAAGGGEARSASEGAVCGVR